jgi:LysR family glycine cleavage system transcriptional activator
MRLDSATFAVEAAVHGDGVVHGRSALVADDLAAGRLVRPFDLAVRAASEYYVVYPSGALRQRKVRAFRDWLLAEVAGDRDAAGR